MTSPNRRRVRMQQFKEQVGEAVLPEGNLIEVDLPTGETVHVKIPIPFTSDDDFITRLQAAEGARESCLVVLGEHPEHDAEEQWAKWEAAGYTEEDLAMLLKAETAAANERLEAFRYRR